MTDTQNTNEPDRPFSQMDLSPGRTVAVIVPPSTEPTEIVLVGIDTKKGRRIQVRGPRGSRLRNDRGGKK